MLKCGIIKQTNNSRRNLILIFILTSYTYVKITRGYISHAFELDPSDPAQWDDIDDRERDSEPDVFSYNVGSYSGKFYFNGPDIVQVPETDLDIIPVFTSTLITGFRIFAPDGTLYEFGDESGSSVDYRENVIDQENEGNASLSHISSWMLRKITSYDGEHTLSFEYQKYTEDQESTNHCVTVYDGTNDETGTDSSLTGTYDLGTHRVIFTATDDCGNEETCDFLFVVIDCTSPIADPYNGLTFDCEGENGTDLFAETLNFNSSDNCGLTDFLLVSPSQGPGQTSPPAEAAR